MKVRIIRIKNAKTIGELKEKKWHKSFLKNIISEMEKSCPLLDFKNKKLYISVEIDKYQHVTNIIFSIDNFDNNVFKVSEIYHSKEKLLQFGTNYGLVTF